MKIEIFLLIHSIGILLPSIFLLLQIMRHGSRVALLKHKMVAAILMIIGAVPGAIESFQFIHNGGTGWWMIWGNEARAWGMIFSIFHLFAFMIVLTQARKIIWFATSVAIATFVTILPSWHDYFVLGLDQSSKGDTNQLQLLGFWVSGWWV